MSVWTLHTTKINTRVSLSPGAQSSTSNVWSSWSTVSVGAADPPAATHFFRFPSTATVPSVTHVFSSRKDAATSLESHHCSTCTVICFLTACPSPDEALTVSYFSRKVFTHSSLAFCRSLYSILGAPRPWKKRVREKENGKEDKRISVAPPYLFLCIYHLPKRHMRSNFLKVLSTFCVHQSFIVTFLPLGFLRLFLFQLQINKQTIKEHFLSFTFRFIDS